VSHAAFINAYLESKGEEPVNFDQFRAPREPIPRALPRALRATERSPATLHFLERLSIASDTARVKRAERVQTRMAASPD
jgi:hypothetical protein